MKRWSVAEKICWNGRYLEKLLLSKMPCDVNTQYASVIMTGMATLLSSEDEKIKVLRKIVEKYVPALAGKAFPQNMIKTTGVIQVDVIECTGKFYA